MKEKRALVTGGASGIGLATALELESRGADVVVVDRDPSRIAALPESLREGAIQLDLSTESAYSDLASHIERLGAGIDYLHLNAGIATGARDISQLPSDLLNAIVAINFLGVVWGVKHLSPLLNEGAAICATASLAGIVPFPPDPVYCATKHAVVGLVRSLGPTLLEKGIRINAVCPGMVDTPLLGPEARQALEAINFPLIDPRDVARAVIYCFEGEFSGECVVCQYGREPLKYEFRGVPGPRGEGVEGKRPLL